VNVSGLITVVAVALGVLLLGWLLVALQKKLKIFTRGTLLFMSISLVLITVIDIAQMDPGASSARGMGHMEKWGSYAGGMRRDRNIAFSFARNWLEGNPGGVRLNCEESTFLRTSIKLARWAQEFGHGKSDGNAAGPFGTLVHLHVKDRWAWRPEPGRMGLVHQFQAFVANESTFYQVTGEIVLADPGQMDTWQTTPHLVMNVTAEFHRTNATSLRRGGGSLLAHVMNPEHFTQENRERDYTYVNHPWVDAFLHEADQNLRIVVGGVVTGEEASRYAVRALREKYDVYNREDLLTHFESCVRHLLDQEFSSVVIYDYRDEVVTRGEGEFVLWVGLSSDRDKLTKIAQRIRNVTFKNKHIFADARVAQLGGR